MNSIRLFFNTFLVYCASGLSPYVYFDIREQIRMKNYDDFKLITYEEYIKRQNKTHEDN